MEINNTFKRQSSIQPNRRRLAGVFTALFCPIFISSVVSYQLAADEHHDPAPIIETLGLSGGEGGIFSESSLRKIIATGAYGMIESTSRHFATASREEKRARFAALSRDLTASKLPHKQITGVYNGHKTDLSFLVFMPAEMDEENFKKILFSLGAKYLQESIIFSAKLRPGEIEKRNYLIFTTGEHAGYSRSGAGFIKNNKDNYSEITTTEGETIVIGAYNLEKEFRQHPELNRNGGE